MEDDSLESYLNAQRFYFLAEQCLNIIKKSLGGTLKKYGLTHTQHLILLVLRYARLSGHEVISTDIAYLLGIEKHSVTAVVDKLVRRDLVIRERSTADRRAVHLLLTSSGDSLAKQLQGETQADISVVPPHAAAEFAHMCDFLQTLRGHIAAAAGQPGQAFEKAFRNLLLDGQEAFRDRGPASGKHPTNGEPDRS